MANEEQQKSAAEYRERAWELIERIRVALFTTWDGTRQAQWPLTAMADRERGVIEFLVGIGRGHYAHLAQFPAVTLGFADPGGQKYVVVNGHAALHDDRERIRTLFSPFARAWWDSADDPDIRLLTITPDRAELWDAPGMLAASAIMLTAAITGNKPSLGAHGTTAL